jgi:hypothetical protein
LPRAFVDTTYPAPTGQFIDVPAGGNLQAALNAAQPGDTITLAPELYRAFALPNKPGSQWITVRTADPTVPPLPGRGEPSDAR